MVIAGLLVLLALLLLLRVTAQRLREPGLMATCECGGRLEIQTLAHLGTLRDGRDVVIAVTRHGANNWIAQLMADFEAMQAAEAERKRQAVTSTLN